MIWFSLLVIISVIKYDLLFIKNKLLKYIKMDIQQFVSQKINIICVRLYKLFAFHNVFSISVYISFFSSSKAIWYRMNLDESI